jgi:hypothetical protein
MHRATARTSRHRRGERDWSGRKSAGVKKKRSRSSRKRRSPSWQPRVSLVRTRVDATAYAGLPRPHARRCHGIRASPCSVRASMPRHTGVSLVRTRVDATWDASLPLSRAGTSHMGQAPPSFKRESKPRNRGASLVRTRVLSTRWASVSRQNSLRIRLNAQSILGKAVAPFVPSRADDAKGPSPSTSKASPLCERTFPIDVEREPLQRKDIPYRRRARASPAKGHSLSTSNARTSSKKTLRFDVNRRPLP